MSNLFYNPWVVKFNGGGVTYFIYDCFICFVVCLLLLLFLFFFFLMSTAVTRRGGDWIHLLLICYPFNSALLIGCTQEEASI